jgi:hypothetical protein
MISDKSVERRLGELSRDIAQRTPGTGDFPPRLKGWNSSGATNPPLR